MHGPDQVTRTAVGFRVGQGRLRVDRAQEASDGPGIFFGLARHPCIDMASTPRDERSKTMRTLMTTLASALVATTALVSPAKADNDLHGFFKQIFGAQKVQRGDSSFKSRSYQRDDDDDDDRGRGGWSSNSNSNSNSSINSSSNSSSNASSNSSSNSDDDD